MTQRFYLIASDFSNGISIRSVSSAEHQILVKFYKSFLENIYIFILNLFIVIFVGLIMLDFSCFYVKSLLDVFRCQTYYP
jgi:hypothetical protein